MPQQSRASAQEPVLHGRRILIVEDIYLIALDASEAISDAGGVVVGPFASCDGALEALRAGGVDAAVLDIDLSGETVYPVAEALRALGIPMIFLTGYDPATVRADFLATPCVQKPCDYEDFTRRIAGLFRR